ncbi:DUF6318 family protein [Geodermatophilus sp. SYSU D01176]
MTRRWTLRLAASLAAGVVVLSGCSERQEASDTLPEADASPSTSAPELPPLGPPDLPMPAEARTQDAAGAEAFVRYYIDLINRTSTVMDAAPLREFSDGCLDCDRIATDAENDAAAGYRYKGGELTITWMEAFMPGDTVEVGFVVDQAPLEVVDAEGRPVAGLTFNAKSGLQSGTTMSWDAQSHSWVMTGLTLG